MSVGVRALKNKLSQYLHRVRRGETIRVTDRGLVIAEIRAPKTSHTPSASLDELVFDGSVTLGRGLRRNFKSKKIKGKGRSAAELLLEDRG